MDPASNQPWKNAQGNSFWAKVGRLLGNITPGPIF